MEFLPLGNRFKFRTDDDAEQVCQIQFSQWIASSFRILVSIRRCIHFFTVLNTFVFQLACSQSEKMNMRSSVTENNDVELPPDGQNALPAKKNDSPGEKREAIDPKDAKEIVFSVTAAQEPALNGLQLTASRTSYGKFKLYYQVNDEAPYKEVFIGYDIDAKRPLEASIKAPSNATVIIQRLDLIDFKTDREDEPFWKDLSEKPIPISGQTPLELSKEKGNSTYKYRLKRTQINPIVVMLQTGPLVLSYQVEYLKSSCLNGSSSNCDTDREPIGPSPDGTLILETGVAEGVPAPTLTWNRSKTTIISISNRDSTPPLGTLFLVLECNGDECPTEKLLDYKTRYHNDSSSPAVIASYETKSFGRYDYLIRDTSGVELIGLPRLDKRYSIEMTLKDVPINFDPQSDYTNEFQFTFKKEMDGQTGTSTYTLTGIVPKVPRPLEVICGTSRQDSCYDGPKAEQAISVGFANTPSGKKLVWREQKFWVERNPSNPSSARILKADGTDEWSRRLTPNGRTYSDVPILYQDANLEGRVCPTHVVTPTESTDVVNFTSSDSCLYYDKYNRPARLALKQDTVQDTLGMISLVRWSDPNSGGGVNPSWYEGNIQTCAAKGMRLPAIYETDAQDYAGSHTLPQDATPVFPSQKGGVPSLPDPAGLGTWTASAFLSPTRDQMDPFGYWIWRNQDGSSRGGVSNSRILANVRCVVP